MKMNAELFEPFIDCFLKADLKGAQQFFDSNSFKLIHEGVQAHPLLAECVQRNDGMCHRENQLLIAELLIPEAVKAFRDAILQDDVSQVKKYLTTNPNLIHAEFTAGRGISQAIHHFVSFEMGELLLEAGANVDARTIIRGECDSPLSLQVRNGNIENVEFLLEKGVNPNQGFLKHMPSESMAEMIQLLQKYNWDINEGRGERTLLHHDANHGFGKRIKILLEHGADPNALDSLGQTALHILAARGTGKDAIQALLDHGSDLSIKNHEGKTALDYAKAAEKNVAEMILLDIETK